MEVASSNVLLLFVNPGTAFDETSMNNEFEFDGVPAETG